ncbi:hypothetical protein KAR91_49975 [Candidatus Pacearchaeota archaeon]|nr:hypothetical protein [Candidatus Pacearchaeota archaeon]
MSIGGYLKSEDGFDGSGFIGGFIQAQGIAGQDGVGVFGGFTNSFGFELTPKSIGGFVNALPLDDASGFFLGGWSDTKHQESAFIGGHAWCIPGHIRFTEMHGRTLVKANSEDTSDQSLNIDATMAFIQRDQEDFNATFSIANTFKSDFNAKLIVGQFKKPPTVFITGVTPPSGIPASGVGIDVCVVASGNLFDGEQWVINQIDFGEPERDELPTANNSISGYDLGNQNPSIWSGCYNYRDAGVYIITARGVDNFGMVGMDHYVLNLASGLIAGTDYPLISISGTPRIGEVPPSLQVDYTLTASGAFSPNTPTDSNLFWNFGNLARSNTVNPFTYYSSPGTYLPTCRFRVNVSGQWRWGADTLRFGYNDAF